MSGNNVYQQKADWAASGLAPDPRPTGSLFGRQTDGLTAGSLTCGVSAANITPRVRPQKMILASCYNLLLLHCV